MLVIVDENEKTTNPSIYKQLEKNFSHLLVTNLPHRDHGGRTVTAGDINIPLDDGSILAIERKTPEDFLQSIGSRHIFDQLEVMSSHAKFSAVIVTGYFTYSSVSDMCMIDGEKTQWPGKSVRSVMSLIQYSGCALIFCPEKEYCNQIVELYNTVNKPAEHKGVTKRRIITFPPVDERVEFLCNIPGISIVLAERLLEFAGMMDNNADEKGYGNLSSAIHWATIMGGVDKKSRPKGWGPMKILTIRKFLGLSSNQYIGLNSEENEITTEGEE